MGRADSDVHAALIFNPNLSITELLRFMLKDFGIEFGFVFPLIRLSVTKSRAISIFD
jgi:hypothetical protein